MLRKIAGEQFIKPQKRPKPVHSVPKNLDLGLRTLLDRDRKILQKYSPLLKNMDALEFPANKALLQGAIADLKDQNLGASLDKFSAAAARFSRKSFRSFDELYAVHPGGWQALDKLLSEISRLPAKDAAQYSARMLNLVLAPRIVAAKVAAGTDAVEYIWALAANASSAVHFEAVNLAINQYLSLVGVQVSNFRAVLCGLPAKIKPRIDGHVAGKIHLHNSRMQLVDLFELFCDCGVPLNTPQMATFLRALCTSSDAGYTTIISSLPDSQFSVTFYHYLVRLLCSRRDTKAVDWIFSNRLMPFVESNPDAVPLFLHALLIRTLEFDGLSGAKSVLTAMGTQVSEQSWKALFVQFRRIGELDRAFDTLRRAVETFGVKLSFPLVNDYLLLVSQHYKPPVFWGALETVLPEHAPTLEQLGLLAHQETPKLGFVLNAKHRSFVPGKIHESTLALAYEVMLNDLYNVDTIMESYNIYETYAVDENKATSMAIVDKFIAKLVALGDAGIDAAESVYRSALARLKIRKPLDGRFGSAGMQHLTVALAHRGDIKGAVAIAVLTSECINMPLRGKALRQLYYAIRDRNQDHARAFAEWAHEQGLILVPDHAQDTHSTHSTQDAQDVSASTPQRIPTNDL